MSTDFEHPARPEHREAFWTLLVGAPAALSVLRLWVESGGELQITLLLVSNVGPLHLGAAFFATTIQLVTFVLVAVFAAGSVLRAAIVDTPKESRLRGQPALVVRATAAVPSWFVATTFVLALLTWKIAYLPLLAPAAVAAFQRPPWQLHDQWPIATGLGIAALAGYGWLVGPAVHDAWTAGEWMIALLFALPPLVSFGMAGPLPTWFACVFAFVTQMGIVGLTVLAVLSAVHTPVLPLVVSEVQTSQGTALLRGHVVSVDDVHLVFLQEHGGVRYFPIDAVRSTVLCGTPEELPAFATRVRGYHVEDSLLSAFGRRVRPRIEIDPLCRIARPALSPDPA